MAKKFFETTDGLPGAKFNLTIDVSPEDSMMMCNELFNNLPADKQMLIINAYLEKVGKNICSCNTEEGEHSCSSCNTQPKKVIT